MKNKIYLILLLLCSNLYGSEPRFVFNGEDIVVSDHNAYIHTDSSLSLAGLKSIKLVTTFHNVGDKKIELDCITHKIKLKPSEWVSLLCTDGPKFHIITSNFNQSSK